MRSFFWLSVAAYAVVWWWANLSLPDRVPLHFGVTGGADNWAGRAEALTLLGLVGVGMTGLLAGCAWFVGRAELTAWWVNLPHKPWWTATPERAARARRMLRDDVYGVGGLTMVLLVVIQAGLVRASNQAEARLGPVTIALALLVLVLLLAWTAWLTVARYRPDEGEA